MPKNIYIEGTDFIAWTAINLPGGDGKTAASDEQVEAHAAKCNAQAVELGIQTRYEVK